MSHSIHASSEIPFAFEILLDPFSLAEAPPFLLWGQALLRRLTLRSTGALTEHLGEMDGELKLPRHPPICPRVLFARLDSWNVKAPMKVDRPQSTSMRSYSVTKTVTTNDDSLKVFVDY